MRQFTSSLAMCLLVAYAGCVGSLHPLYTAESAIEDDRIVGKWVEYDPVYEMHGRSSLVITENGNKVYTLTKTTKKGVFNYDLHLVSVGDMTFWDLHRKMTDAEKSEPGSFVRLHQFIRYELADNKMRQFVCEVKKFEETLIAEKVPFVKKDDQIIITAETNELHNFLSKHGKQIFPEFLPADLATVFHRKPDEKK